MQKNPLILLPWAGSQAEHARHKLPIKTIKRMLMIRQVPEITSSIADFHSSLLLPCDVVEGSRLHSKFFSLVCGRPRTGILLGMLYSSMCFQPWAAAKWSVGSSTSLGDASRPRDVRATSFSSPAPNDDTSASCSQPSKFSSRDVRFNNLGIQDRVRFVARATLSYRESDRMPVSILNFIRRR